MLLFWGYKLAVLCSDFSECVVWHQQEKVEMLVDDITVDNNTRSRFKKLTFAPGAGIVENSDWFLLFHIILYY